MYAMYVVGKKKSYFSPQDFFSLDDLAHPEDPPKYHHNLTHKNYGKIMLRLTPSAFLIFK